MAEVTRVPLQPVPRNSLIMLFLGIVLGALLAGGAGLVDARPRRSTSRTSRAGTGGNPEGDRRGLRPATSASSTDGTVFDQSQEMPLPIQGIMPDGTPMPLERRGPRLQGGDPADAEGRQVHGLHSGRRRPTAPGRPTRRPATPIPPNADLTFEIELVDFMPMADAEAKFQQLQMAMMQQQAAGRRRRRSAAPGGQLRRRRHRRRSPRSRRFSANPHELLMPGR